MVATRHSKRLDLRVVSVQVRAPLLVIWRCGGMVDPIVSEAIARSYRASQFKSGQRHIYFCALLAHQVERRSCKPEVVGAGPTWGFPIWKLEVL